MCSPRKVENDGEWHRLLLPTVENDFCLLLKYVRVGMLSGCHQRVIEGAVNGAWGDGFRLEVQRAITLCCSSQSPDERCSPPGLVGVPLRNSAPMRCVLGGVLISVVNWLSSLISHLSYPCLPFLHLLPTTPISLSYIPHSSFSFQDKLDMKTFVSTSTADWLVYYNSHFLDTLVWGRETRASFVFLVSAYTPSPFRKVFLFFRRPSDQEIPVFQRDPFIFSDLRGVPPGA